MGIIFWILISLYLWYGIWVKNLCEQIHCQRERHMAELHTLPHEVFAYKYIYIYIYWLLLMIFLIQKIKSYKSLSCLTIRSMKPSHRSYKGSWSWLFWPRAYVTLTPISYILSNELCEPDNPLVGEAKAALCAIKSAIEKILKK